MRLRTKAIQFERNHLTARSQSKEDFLKAVYVLQQSVERVSTNALADALNIAAPSVTDMARRMEVDGMVEYKKYRGVRLTQKGERHALHVLRRHRLLELYLVNELGYELHEVHKEAEDLEHAVSDYFVEAIAAKLGHPSVDPHGDPIPTADGIITQRNLVALTELPLHTSATVSRLKADKNDMLQHILDRGFKLGAVVYLTSLDPFQGPLTAQVDNHERVIGYNVAETILVEVNE